MRIDAGGHSPRDGALGLAGVYVRLHDGAGVPGRTGYLSGWHAHSAAVILRNLVMTFDAQNLVAVMVVLTAAGYLARVAWTSITRRKDAACGGCPSCPENGRATNLVEISAPTQKRSS